VWKRDVLLKTQEASRVLGVSVSTLKRWVDAGAIRACRTVGKHRLIAASEALRFARERSLSTADLETLVGLKNFPRDCGAGADAASGLATALKRGRSLEARSLILSAYAAGGDAADLADNLIRPAMEEIGHEWSIGALDVYQEHRAARMVESSLNELLQRVPSPSGPAPWLAMGATPEGDGYTLPGLLAELTLRELGWEATNLGPNLPMASLARAIEAHRPRLIWLSVHHLADPCRFLAGYEVVSRASAAVDAAMIAGGHALGPELRARMVDARFGDRLCALRELARELQAARPAIGPGTPESPASFRH